MTVSGNGTRKQEDLGTWLSESCVPHMSLLCTVLGSVSPKRGKETRPLEAPCKRLWREELRARPGFSSVSSSRPVRPLALMADGTPSPLRPQRPQSPRLPSHTASPLPLGFLLLRPPC